MELTNEEVDVIFCLLDDIDNIFGLKPEELELKEKIKRWLSEND